MIWAMESQVKNLKETELFAGKLLKESITKERPIVFALYGQLGAGKTTFTKALARELKIEETVTSPTFLLMKTFNIPKEKEGLSQLIHIDAYRVDSAKEFLDLGLEKILTNKKNIVVIEWPEKLKEYLPQQTIHLHFEVVGENKRKIHII
jgi:tRNA threonylcarbamoyladenosine biosynthesis protein TsaE